MNARTYTSTVAGRQITCEVVNTWELNEGDTIFNHGHLMQCGPFEDEVSKWGNTPQYDDKGARWCDAVVLTQDGGIPKGWMGRAENGDRTWRIQGNTLATWSRVIQSIASEEVL